MPLRGMELHEELFLFAFGVARPFADAGDVFEVARFDADLVFKDNAAGGHFFHRAFYDGIRSDDRIDKTFFSDKLFCQFFHDALLLVLLFSVQMMPDCRDFQSLLPQDDKDNDENRNQPTQVLHFFSVTPPARQPVPLFKAIPHNSDGTNHNLKSRIFLQTIQKSAGCSRATGKDFCEV